MNQKVTMLSEIYDPNQGALMNGGGSQLPVGEKLLVEVIDAELRPTRAEDGGMVCVTFKVCEGEFSGATGSENYNIFNKSEDAVRIARGKYNTLCFAIGQSAPFQDLTLLLNKQLRVDVVADKKEPEKYTNINKYYFVDGSTVTKSGPSQQTQQSNAFQGQQTQQQAPSQQAQNTQGGPFGQFGGQGQQTQQGGFGGQATPQNQQPAQGGFGGNQFGQGGGFGQGGFGQGGFGQR